MARFFVFSGQEYEECGGLRDYIGSADTIAEAHALTEAHAADNYDDWRQIATVNDAGELVGVEGCYAGEWAPWDWWFDERGNWLHHHGPNT
jgi:hypothetical protein